MRFPRVPDGELLLAIEICAGLGALVSSTETTMCAGSRSAPRRAGAVRWRMPSARPPVAEINVGHRLVRPRDGLQATAPLPRSVERGFALVGHALSDGVDATAET